MIPSLEDIQKYAEALFHAPWWVLSALFAFTCCVGLRKSKCFPNSWIPISCMVLTAIPTVIFSPKQPPETPVLAYRGTCFMAGWMLGFATWGFHRVVVSKLEEKFPSLKGALGGIVGDDTTPPFVPPK